MLWGHDCPVMTRRPARHGFSRPLPRVPEGGFRDPMMGALEPLPPTYTLAEGDQGHYCHLQKSIAGRSTAGLDIPRPPHPHTTFQFGASQRAMP
jgi:hypothetical protein